MQGRTQTLDPSLPKEHRKILPRVIWRSFSSDTGYIQHIPVYLEERLSSRMPPYEGLQTFFPSLSYRIIGVLKMWMLKYWPRVPQNATLFGDRGLIRQSSYGEVTRVNPNAVWLVSLDEKEIRTPAHAHKRGDHVKAEADNSHLQPKDRGSEGTCHASTCLSDLQPPELWENWYLLSKTPICGALLQQP